MNYLATITSKRQLTIPAELYRQLDFKEGERVIVSKKGSLMLVEQKKNFWQLSGGMKSNIKLTDAQLKKARKSFSTAWAQE